MDVLGRLPRWAALLVGLAFVVAVLIVARSVNSPALRLILLLMLLAAVGYVTVARFRAVFRQSRDAQSPRG